MRREPNPEGALPDPAPAPAETGRAVPWTLAIFLLGYPPSYLTQILFSRWLGAEDYGDYSVAVSVAALVTTLALLGLDKATMKFLPLYEGPREAGRARGFLGFTFRTVLAFGLVLALVGWIGARFAERLLHADEHPVRHAMFLVLPMCLSILLVQAMAGQRRPVLASFVLKMALPLTLVGLALGANFLHPLTEMGAVWVTVAANSLIAVALVALLVPSWRRRFRGRQPEYARPEWMATARAFLATSFAATLLDQSGILILELIHHSEADVGIFSAARFTAGYPMLVLAALRMVSMPRFVRSLDGDRAAFVRELRRNLWILAATGLLAMGLWAVAGDAFLGLFGIHAEAAHLTLVVLGVGYLAGLVFGLAVPLMQIRSETGMIYRTSLVLLASNVGLAFLLVPFYGHLGAALAFTLSIFAVSAYEARWVEKHLGIPYLSLLRYLPGSSADRA
ncbi:MAG: oligosaccharide flippase family protein [Holophagales bacterium]|nr:oligosaccharide flippase family protein [Holophagales bacterium]